MLFGALGDIHGEFDALARVMRRHPEVAFWVSVGDVAGDRGRYAAPPAPLYWIKGNNEDFDFIAGNIAGTAGLDNLHYLPNAVARRVASLTIVGLGGTFAPTWYETPAADLPGARSVGPRTWAKKPGRARDDKRRHFVREEVEACKALRGIDLFLTHEAARPFFVGGRRTSVAQPASAGRRPDARSTRGLDAGKTPINEVLAAMRPRLHLFGHHHRFDVAVRQGVPSICLAPISTAYLLIDAETLQYQTRDA